jgi:hypothetical protein
MNARSVGLDLRQSLRERSMPRYLLTVLGSRGRLVEIEVEAPSARRAYFVGMIGHPTDCYLCGEPLTHESAVLEHVQPRARRGDDLPENYRWACAPCNRIKSTHTLEELLTFARRLLARYPL